MPDHHPICGRNPLAYRWYSTVSGTCGDLGPWAAPFNTHCVQQSANVCGLAGGSAGRARFSLVPTGSREWWSNSQFLPCGRLPLFDLFRGHRTHVDDLDNRLVRVGNLLAIRGP